MMIENLANGRREMDSIKLLYAQSHSLDLEIDIYLRKLKDLYTKKLELNKKIMDELFPRAINSTDRLIAWQKYLSNS